MYGPLLAGDRPTPPASLRALALLAGSLPQVLTTNLDNLVSWRCQAAGRRSVAAKQEELAELRQHLESADKLLDPMEANGQLQGFAERAAVRTMVNDLLTKFPK